MHGSNWSAAIRCSTMPAGSTSARYVVNDYGAAALALGVDYSRLAAVDGGPGNDTADGAAAAIDTAALGTQVRARRGFGLGLGLLVPAAAAHFAAARGLLLPRLPACLPAFNQPPAAFAALPQPIAHCSLAG